VKFLYSRARLKINLLKEKLMELDPLTVNVVGENFLHLVVEGRTAGNTALLSFTNTREMTPLHSALLLSANTNVTLLHDYDCAVYPIFFADGEVEIEFRVHVNTIRNEYALLAFITSRSQTGKILTRVHGL
jgi:hypothetical protein